MFTIKEEVKQFVEAQKANLKPKIILNLVRNVIVEMLKMDMPKAYILKYLNEQLNTDINYQTFNSYIKSLKVSNKTSKNTGTPKKSGYTNPLHEMLGIKPQESKQQPKKEREIKII